MNRTIIILCLLLSAMLAFAQKRSYTDELQQALRLSDKSLPASCDTIIVDNGYNLRVVKQDSAYRHIGLNLFANEIRSSLDNADDIESSLLAQALNLKINGTTPVRITKGSIASLKSVSPATACVIGRNAEGLTVQWNIGKTPVAIAVGERIQGPQSKSRSANERNFIAALKSSRTTAAPAREINADMLEPYKENIYIVPGSTYQNKEISNTVYVGSDSLMTPVWSDRYPEESMADLFCSPHAQYANVGITLKVMKHDYGQQETVSAPVARLLAVAAKEGCQPFWGIERFDGSQLVGSLFLYNHKLGYVHVLNVTCKPSDVIKGNGQITARASLYVPTNNIHNLVAPYKKKTAKQRIKYRQ